MISSALMHRHLGHTALSWLAVCHVVDSRRVYLNPQGRLRLSPHVLEIVSSVQCGKEGHRGSCNVVERLKLDVQFCHL